MASHHLMRLKNYFITVPDIQIALRTVPCAAAYNRVAQFDHLLNGANPRTVIAGNSPVS